MALNLNVGSGAIFQIARRFMPPCDVLLDIGPGIRPFDMLQAKLHICAEPYKEYIDHYQKKVLEGVATPKLYINMDWKKVTETFPEQSVDTVVLMDVIEHLEKEDGMDLLKKTERIARKSIIIFTPLGFMPQCHPDGIDAWGLGGATYQEHKSGWTPHDFGDQYVTVVAEAFHHVDHAGVPFEKPYGAFFAIRTQNNSLSPT